MHVGSKAVVKLHWSTITKLVSVYFYLNQTSRRKMSENSESTEENAWCDSEFWNVNCLFSLIVLPNLVLWLLVCIPMCIYIRNEDKHKKWWWNLLHIRYFLMWIVIISMVNCSIMSMQMLFLLHEDIRLLIHFHTLVLVPLQS